LSVIGPIRPKSASDGSANAAGGANVTKRYWMSHLRRSFYNPAAT
jgi:hypothetical protein